MTLPPAGPDSDRPERPHPAPDDLCVPLITVFYGNVIPAGVFLYRIVSTLYQIVQQFLIIGWGGMFPLFGWYPAFAVDHTPRFPVAVSRRPIQRSEHRPVLTTTASGRPGGLDRPTPRTQRPTGPPRETTLK